MIHNSALKVIKVLHENNFDAYLVGGCVRDLLLGMKPKDFDVATNAKPLEIKSLFARSRVVGRRFQIAHVKFGREIIEVTTFRSSATDKDDSLAKDTHLQQADNGILTRDNLFGTISDDADRRDFSINALYYNPVDNTIHDFTNGLRDIEDRTIRVIGDPSTRFKEDPVRLLRVARFAAKLGFSVEPKTLRVIPHTAKNLAHISPPRLFDETLKLFINSQSLATFGLLVEYDLFTHIMPQINLSPKDGDNPSMRLIEQTFTNTDLRTRKGKTISPAFIYAALLWLPVCKLRAHYESLGMTVTIALNKASNEVIARQVSITAIPRRFTTAMRDIWLLQLALPRRSGNRAKRLLLHPRFRAAYDFILLREQVGEDLGGLGNWWTTYQEIDEQERQAMVNALSAKRRNNRDRRKIKKSPQ
jgi:poly(A) polymerase